MKQREMLVEDCAQKFRVLAARLEGSDRLLEEMKASYFLKGLISYIRETGANVDVATRSDALVTLAARVEKRLGIIKSKNKKRNSNDDSNFLF